MARKFAKRIKSRLPKQKVELIATERAGHAEELAYSLAKSSKNPLIVSSSGDGGYHEVVNGALKAQNEGRKVTTGLLPAGNANDHYRTLHKKGVVEQIAKGKVQKIDVLKIVGRSKGKLVERYAHSYIGIGLTPKVGRELNRTKLNLLNEAIIVLKVLFLAKSTKLKVYGEVKHYDSIIFSNMTPYIKLTSLDEYEQYLKPGITLEHLETQAYAMSRVEWTKAMQDQNIAMWDSLTLESKN